MAKPVIVKETKREVREARPPSEIRFVYLPGKTTPAALRSFARTMIHECREKGEG